MGTSRKFAIKSLLQQVFIRRVQEEMDEQGLSRNALAGREGAPTQSTLNDVMRGADPSLETVSKIATALGVQAWELMTERRIGREIHVKKISQFPTYPPMLGKGDKKLRKNVIDRRKERP